MKIEDIASMLKAKRNGNTFRSRCPVHNGKHLNLWFSQVGDKIYFECKKGCHYLDIRQAVGLRGSEKIEGCAQVVRDPIKEQLARQKILNVWQNATPIDLKSDSPAAVYLRDTRQVLLGDDICPAVLRETRQRYYDSDFNVVGEFACMVARLDISDGSIVNVHRTYLSNDGRKAPVDKPKKLMSSPYSGATDGAAIRLFPKQRSTDSGLILGIAEGIETALAVRKLFGVNTWATWCSAGMAKFVPPIDLTALNIYVDNDESGRKSAGQIIRRLAEERVSLETRCHLPNLIGQDWDNVWQQQNGTIKPFTPRGVNSCN